MAKQETIRERLARMETKQDFMCKQFTNHLRHHWGVTLALLTTTLSLTLRLVFITFFSK